MKKQKVKKELKCNFKVPVPQGTCNSCNKNRKYAIGLCKECYLGLVKKIK